MRHTAFKNKTHYCRIGIIEIPGNEFVSLDWMDRCNRYKLSRSVWRETVCDRCYSRNGHQTAMPRTAFQVFVTCGCTIPGTWRLLPCHALHFKRVLFQPCHAQAFGVCDCCDYIHYSLSHSQTILPAIRIPIPTPPPSLMSQTQLHTFTENSMCRQCEASPVPLLLLTETAWR